MITDPFDTALAIDWLDVVDYVLMRAIPHLRVDSSDNSSIQRLLVGSNAWDQYI
jgi:hypothetical protein